MYPIIKYLGLGFRVGNSNSSRGVGDVYDLKYLGPEA